jgi:hypothetical protein
MPKYHAEYIRTETYRAVRNFEADNDQQARRMAEQFLQDGIEFDGEVMDGHEELESLVGPDCQDIVLDVNEPKASDQLDGSSIRSRIRRHNHKLDLMMGRLGYTFVRRGQYEHFIDSSGAYVAYPNDYIRGPQRSDNGSPQPWSYSIQGSAGWIQRSFKTLQLADQWIAEQLTRMENVDESSK